MKIGEVARRLGVTNDIVRYAANSYSDHLGDSAGGRDKGTKRQFSERDCQMIATILKMRDNGLTPTQIGAALATVDLEPCPDEPSPLEAATRQSIALVAQPEYARALDKVTELQRELADTKGERDKALQTWQSDVSRYTDRIAELEHQLGEAEGTLKERKPTEHWLERLDSERRRWLVVLAAAVAVAVMATAVLLLLAR